MVRVGWTESHTERPASCSRWEEGGGGRGWEGKEARGKDGMKEGGTQGAAESVSREGRRDGGIEERRAGRRGLEMSLEGGSRPVRWCRSCREVRCWLAGCWGRGWPLAACCPGGAASSHWYDPDPWPPQNSGSCAGGWILEWLQRQELLSERGLSRLQATTLN